MSLEKYNKLIFPLKFLFKLYLDIYLYYYWGLISTHNIVKFISYN